MSMYTPHTIYTYLLYTYVLIYLIYMCVRVCVYVVYLFFFGLATAVYRRFRFAAAVFATETQRGGRDKVKAKITRVYNIMRAHTMHAYTYNEQEGR